MVILIKKTSCRSKESDPLADNGGPLQAATPPPFSQAACRKVPELYLPGHLPGRAKQIEREPMSSEVIELSGHIIDSWTLPRAWDVIMDRGGNFAVEEMRVGTSKTEPSYARLKIMAPDDKTLELILSELQQFVAVLLHGNDVQTASVEQQGVLPPMFYSTTNLPTQVRIHGQWVDVENIEMDVAIVIDKSTNRTYRKPTHAERA